MHPFTTVRYYSEDIGISMDWNRIHKNSAINIGGYYSCQSSPLGAGIWFHFSGFVSTRISPNVNDLDFTLGGNCGVTFLLLELKAKYNIKQENFAFVPAIGLGINRLIYGMVDYYVQSGKNDWGWRVVFRLPIFTRGDKGGIESPAYE
ncbi:MAG: hypothetical protein H6600_07870 [Flavobacteriales bacterium]|nr:hypothetical protein [Flavobacteriales bacterium]MCB9195456.1 hypothetical protein [Flavobacteriales bacterium]MCB9198360.1 hypothetical protein [Flavobacteriales bacterium]